MSSSRIPRDYDPVNVEVILLGVTVDPAESAAAIFDGGGRMGYVGHSVFNIDDRPSHFKIGKDAEGRAFLAPVGPSPAVKIDKSWVWARDHPWLINIQLEIHPTSSQICEVWNNTVPVGDVYELHG